MRRRKSFIKAQIGGRFIFIPLMRLLFDKSFMQPDDMVELLRLRGLEIDNPQRVSHYIYATSVIIGRAVVEHYMTKTGTVEKRKDGAVCTHLFNINRIIFTDSSLNPLTFGSFICVGDKSTRK